MNNMSIQLIVSGMSFLSEKPNRNRTGVFSDSRFFQSIILGFWLFQLQDRTHS